MINPPRLDLHPSHLVQCRQTPSQNFCNSQNFYETLAPRKIFMKRLREDD